MPDDLKTPEQGAEDTSVRADLERAFEEAAAKAPADDTSNTPPPPAPDKKLDAPPAPAAPKGDDNAPSGDKPSDGKPAKAGGIEAPVRWTKEEKEAWDKMTEGLDEKSAAAVQKIQQILVGRNRSMEGEFTKQMQAIAADRAYKAEIDSVLQPHRDMWKKAGLNDSAALKELLDGYAFSNRDPIGFMKWIAQMRGIDLQRAFGGAPQQPQRGGQQPAAGNDDDVELHPKVQQYLDDVMAQNQALQQELAQLRQGYQGVAGHISQQQQAELERMHSQVSNDLQQFESAVDEHGQAKHPFFNDVRQDMSRLINSGLAENLQDAYDKAVWARPDIRQKVLENQQMAARREWEKKLQEDAKRARGAAGSLAPGAPAVVPINNGDPAQPDSVRQALEAAVNAQLGRQRI